MTIRAAICRIKFKTSAINVEKRRKVKNVVFASDTKINLYRNIHKQTHTYVYIYKDVPSHSLTRLFYFIAG